jgi:hypothetical protein
LRSQWLTFGSDVACQVAVDGNEVGSGHFGGLGSPGEYADVVFALAVSIGVTVFAGSKAEYNEVRCAR